MNRRAEEIRKRIMKRNEQRKHDPYDVELPPYQLNSSDYIQEEKKNKGVGYLLKILLSIALVLGAGVVYQGDKNGELATIRKGMDWIFTEEFQFTALRSWFEEEWNISLAPLNLKDEAAIKEDFALPASGKVMKDFKSDGQSVTVMMNAGDAVEASNEGTVIFIGEKEGFGNTVVIQHSDNSEAWYGNLDKITVKLYDFVQVKQKIAYVKGIDGNMGELVFAIKKNDKFIDPIQVIPFE